MRILMILPNAASIQAAGFDPTRWVHPANRDISCWHPGASPGSLIGREYDMVIVDSGVPRTLHHGEAIGGRVHRNFEQALHYLRSRPNMKAIIQL